MRYLILLVLLLLTGCASLPQPAVQHLPPVELLQPCRVSGIRLETNGDLSTAVLILAEALGACDRDKTALREWAGDSHVRE